MVMSMRRSIRWGTGAIIALFSGAIAYNLFFIQSAIKRNSDGRAVIVEPDRLGELAALAASEQAPSTRPAIRVSVRPKGISAQERNPARAAAILAVQRDLKALGFYDGALDGKLGPKTKAAIAAFQRKLGMKVTGVPDAATVERIRYELTLRRSIGDTASLGEVPSARPRHEAEPRDAMRAPNLASLAAAASMDRAAVMRLQRKLKVLGYDPGPIDGELGPATQRAIRHFQKDTGLDPTGLPDATVMMALGL